VRERERERGRPLAEAEGVGAYDIYENWNEYRPSPLRLPAEGTPTHLTRRDTRTSRILARSICTAPGHLEENSVETDPRRISRHVEKKNLNAEREREREREREKERVHRARSRKRGQADGRTDGRTDKRAGG